MNDGNAAVMGYWMLVTLSGLACLGLAWVYNGFIEGRFHLFGIEWSNDASVDLSVVMGVAMVSVCWLVAYALYPAPPMDAGILALLVFWYYVVWGLPMIIGFRRRVQRARRLFDEGIAASWDGVNKARYWLWVARNSEEVRHFLDSLDEGDREPGVVHEEVKGVAVAGTGDRGTGHGRN